MDFGKTMVYNNESVQYVLFALSVGLLLLLVPLEYIQIRNYWKIAPFVILVHNIRLCNLPYLLASFSVQLATV